VPVTNPHAEWHPIARHGDASIMVPRVVILHTNAASVPASMQACWNVANAGGKNTQPHFQVQMDGTAWQMLETRETGVASYKANGFSIAIETQDQGYPGPGDVQWTPVQLERLAQIIAHECRQWGIPTVQATAWDGEGIGWHSMWGINQSGRPPVNPWTSTVGKTCPGSKRIAQMPHLIARVRALVDPPVIPPPVIDPPPIDPPEVDVTQLVQIHPTYIIRHVSRPARFLRVGADVDWLPSGSEVSGLVNVAGIGTVDLQDNDQDNRAYDRYCASTGVPPELWG
jgi:hypothetical protein